MVTKNVACWVRILICAKYFCGEILVISRPIFLKIPVNDRVAIVSLTYLPLLTKKILNIEGATANSLT